MLALGPGRERFYPALLPHLCFNRYDVAEGVASYSLATWCQVMGEAGRTWVARCLPQVVGPTSVHQAIPAQHAKWLLIRAAPRACIGEGH